ncbi:MAG: hypothetical protein QW478_04910 [Candidatus Micrarchaeaceae archaeon]
MSKNFKIINFGQIDEEEVAFLEEQGKLLASLILAGKRRIFLNTKNGPADIFGKYKKITTSHLTLLMVDDGDEESPYPFFYYIKIGNRQFIAHKHTLIKPYITITEVL